jgi:PAS domain S-box-containing protein
MGVSRSIDFRKLLDAAPCRYLVLQPDDPHFTVIFVNRAYARAAGTDASELVGRGVLEALPGDAEGLLGSLREAIVSKAGGEFAGSSRNYSYTPIFDDAGKVEFILLSRQEATESAPPKNFESDVRFSIAFADAPIGMVLLNLNGVVFDANQAFSKMLGYSRDDLIGRASAGYTHPEDMAATREFFSSLRSAPPSPLSLEKRYITREGETLWARATLTKQRHDGGNSDLIIAVVEDITARKRAQERYRFLAENIPQMVWTAGPGGQLEFLSTQAKDYFAVPLDVLLGAGWLEWVHPEDQERTVRTWTQAVQTGSKYEVEYRLKRGSDGAFRWHLVRGTPFKDEKGNVLEWFGTCTDMEDRKRMEQADLSKQKLESLGLLAGGIAHDFNNLLVGVLGGASIAVETLPKSHALQPTLELIVSSAERAAHLTRQMLAYSGKGRIFIETVDIAELVRSTLNLIKGSIPNHVDVALDMPDRLPAVEADSGQMQQIVMNLVLNAAESIDPARSGFVLVRTVKEHLDAAAIARQKIVCGALEPGTYLVLEVRDNGSGMDEETQKKIFDPFFTTKFTGRGLGLSAVQGILRGHDGALQLNSTPGRGSHFRIFLRASSAAPSIQAPLAEPASGEGFTVLVVDDEQSVRQTAKVSLEHAGYRVLLAESGTHGIRTLEEGRVPIDLLLLDMSMPGVSGKDVMEKIRLLGSDVPVLIFSGFSEEQVYCEFSGLGIDGFIQKPFTARQLAAKVKSVIAGAARRPQHRTGSAS